MYKLYAFGLKNKHIDPIKMQRQYRRDNYAGELYMFEKAKKAVAGTAREASENYKYGRLVDKFGEELSEVLMKPHLQERGLSVEEFRAYRKVKKVIQNQGLDVAKAHKDADQEAKEALLDCLPA